MTSLGIALGLALLPLPKLAQAPQIDCTWLVVDTAAHAATLQLGAGLTAANEGRNFNGFRDGALTLTVPLNWSVVLQFTNKHASMPHSAAVIDSVRPLPGGGGLDRSIRHSRARRPLNQRRGSRPAKPKRFASRRTGLART